MNSWDEHYSEDIENLDDDQDEASPTTWFEDVKAPERILNFLTSSSFPLAPKNSQSSNESPKVIDLGTGNGQTLFQLRQAGFHGPMVGVDYSQTSIELANRLAKEKEQSGVTTFDTMNIIKDDPSQRAWWSEGGFDLVLDKGTFDAISLSEETVPSESGEGDRINTLYPLKAIDMVKSGGFLLVTSCNWTQDELIRWFTQGKVEGRMEVFDTIEYPRFKFGGVEGQAVSTVCFRRKLEK